MISGFISSLAVSVVLALAAGASVSARADVEATDPSPIPVPALVAPVPTNPEKPRTGPAKVWVIPVDEAIGKPVFYVIRRGLKQAEEAGATAVVLDMDTPGGRLDVTMEIMEALDKFEGETIVYVNTEAISAGAIISSVADEIRFAPKGIIGAAAAVGGDGKDIEETMKQKLNSYMAAKVLSFNEGKGLRAQVIKAMMDADYEFKVGETVIKPKGELLTLTAAGAAKTYGEPPQALLSSGTHDTLEAMLESKYGKAGYAVTRLEVTWSEKLASWLSKVTPILMGLGLLAIFIEFKTPGFGVFGISGGVLLALVFFGHYTAGLSGHVPALLFLFGVALVLVELLLLPGTLVAGLTGAVLMLGSLAWSMVDVWPNEMPTLDAETLNAPLINVGLALVVAAVTALALGRFLPHGWFWDKMILQASVAGDAGTPAAGMGGDGQVEAAISTDLDAMLGASGVAVSDMRPMGEIEVEGRRYEARTDLGSLERGAKVRISGLTGRTFIVTAEKNPPAQTI